MLRLQELADRYAQVKRRRRHAQRGRICAGRGRAVGREPCSSESARCLSAVRELGACILLISVSTLVHAGSMIPRRFLYPPAGVAVGGDAGRDAGVPGGRAAARWRPTGASCGLFGEDNGSKEAKNGGVAQPDPADPADRPGPASSRGRQLVSTRSTSPGGGNATTSRSSSTTSPRPNCVPARPRRPPSGAHDLFAFPSLLSAFEDDVVDHRDLVEEVRSSSAQPSPRWWSGASTTRRRASGPGSPTSGPRTSSTTGPTCGRTAGMPAGPDTVDDLRRVGPALRNAGASRSGFGSFAEFDSQNIASAVSPALLRRVRRERGRERQPRPARTVEAVKVGR